MFPLWQSEKGNAEKYEAIGSSREERKKGGRVMKTVKIYSKNAAFHKFGVLKTNPVWGIFCGGRAEHQ